MQAGEAASVSRLFDGAGLTPPFLVSSSKRGTSKQHDTIKAALREACQAADHFKREAVVRDSAPKGRTFELFVGPLRPHNKR